MWGGRRRSFLLQSYFSFSTFFFFFFSPSSFLFDSRCQGLFPGFPACRGVWPCLPCWTCRCPEVSAPPVYPEASPCPPCPPCPVYPVYPAAWPSPACPGGCHCRGPSPCRPYPRLLGGCCRTAVLCWTIRHLEVTGTTDTAVLLLIKVFLNTFEPLFSIRECKCRNV